MIKYRILFLYCALLMLPACKNDSNPVATSDLFVQLDTPSMPHGTILEEIAPIINASIKRGLGLDEDYNFEFFIPKKRQAVTIYYLRGVQGNGIEQLLTALDQTEKNHWHALNDAGITLAPRVEFFAGPFGEADELVMMLDDPRSKLLALHTELKNLFHGIDQRYSQVHSHSLYDRAKSEQYPYVPHIGLGRIRSTAIKEQSKDGDQIIKIKERIKQDVLSIAQRLCAKINCGLHIHALGVFDLQKRKVLREYRLAPEGQ